MTLKLHKFCSLPIVLLLTACPTDKKEVEIEQENPTIKVDTKPETDLYIDFSIEQQDKFVSIIPTKIPRSLSSLRCFIDAVEYNDCLNGLYVSSLKEGDHELLAIYEVNSLSYSDHFYFSLKDDGLADTGDSDNPVAPFIIHKVGTSEEFTNNQAVIESKDLDFEFAISTPKSCTPRLMCSNIDDFWYQCSKERVRKFSVPAHRLFLGQQTLKVKAICEGTEQESNIETFSFYGVSESYQPLGLRTKALGRFTLVEPERPLDCFGTITSECLESGTEFEPCSNLLNNQGPEVEIRSSCRTPDEIISKGPAFQFKP